MRVFKTYNQKMSEKREEKLKRKNESLLSLEKKMRSDEYLNTKIQEELVKREHHEFIESLDILSNALQEVYRFCVRYIDYQESPHSSNYNKLYHLYVDLNAVDTKINQLKDSDIKNQVKEVLEVAKDVLIGTKSKLGAIKIYEKYTQTSDYYSDQNLILFNKYKEEVLQLKSHVAEQFQILRNHYVFEYIFEGEVYYVDYCKPASSSLYQRAEFGRFY